MIWFKYKEHDYMDESPSVGFRLFEDEAQAYAWEKHMQENYSGGRTWIVGPATKTDVLSYIEENHIQLDELTKKNIENDAYYKDMRTVFSGINGMEYLKGTRLKFNGETFETL